MEIFNNGKFALGIDVGKTKSCLAVISEGGEIVKLDKFPTRTGLSISDFAELLFKNIAKLEIETTSLAGIGVGVRGLVSYKEKRLLSSSLFGGTLQKDFRQIIEKHYKIPTYIDNDVKAATIAEALFGEGKGKDDFVFINIGTGIGMGAYSNGKLIRGKENFAGEISDYLVDVLNESKQAETLEDHISGEALNNQAKMIKAQRIKRSDMNHMDIKTLSLLDAASKGDRQGLEIIRRFIGGLLGFIHNIECILDPQLIVLGGGVMSNPLMVETLTKLDSLRKQSVQKGHNSPLVITKLGAETIGVLGAASLVFSHK